MAAPRLLVQTAIPVSLLASVLVLDYFGIALNIMVMGGLAIALGEVVDDAIIDTENIFRRMRLNRFAHPHRPVEEVVLAASVEVRSSVVYATFIVALVFVPLLTLGGVAGKLFAPLGLAYISPLSRRWCRRYPDAGAVLSASSRRGAEGRRSAVRALVEAPVSVDLASHRALSG